MTSHFNTGDGVTFTDAGLANGSTVNIVAAGIAPDLMQIQNTTGTYTFTGGAIGGWNILSKSGERLQC